MGSVAADPSTTGHKALNPGSALRRIATRPIRTQCTRSDRLSVATRACADDDAVWLFQWRYRLSRSHPWSAVRRSM